MICAECDREIPANGVICPACNAVEPSREPAAHSHRSLAHTVRRLKGLVLVSLMFGLIVAPFAIYSATKALHEHRDAAMVDSANRRQIVVLRRVATGLLIFWAFIVGTQVAWLRAG
jgi:hypothetical protein